MLFFAGVFIIAKEVIQMLVILKQVVILALFSLIGCVLAKKKVINSDQGGMLSALAVYVFLPCTAFNTFCTNFTVEYLTEKYPLIIVATVIMVILIVAAKLIAKKIQPTGYDRVVYEYSMIISNCSYMGYPLMLSLFGSEGLLDMMLFGLPHLVYTYTIGYDLLTERTGKGFSFKRLLTPVVVAMLLGCVVGLFQIPVPDVITQVTGSAGACLGPTGMLLLGITLSKFKPRELLVHKKVYFITAMRLVIIPVVIFGALKLLGLDYAIVPAIVTYAMPCGMNVVIFPQMVGRDCSRGAALMLISTVLSILTIPVCVYFMCG